MSEHWSRLNGFDCDWLRILQFLFIDSFLSSVYEATWSPVSAQTMRLKLLAIKWSRTGFTISVNSARIRSKLLSLPIFPIRYRRAALSYRNYVTNLYGNCQQVDNWPKRTTHRNDDWFQLATVVVTRTAYCDSLESRDKLNCWDASRQWIRPINRIVLEANNWFAPRWQSIIHFRTRREVGGGDVNICFAVSDDTAADAGLLTVDCLQISWCRWFIYSARANKNDFCRGKSLNGWCWLTDNRFFSGHGANPLKWFICLLSGIPSNNESRASCLPSI